MGLTGGVVGILCCTGPTVLALLGVVSAGTAFAWAPMRAIKHPGRSAGRGAGALGRARQ
ncbi:MAG TPA: hypothetical protein VHH52_03795 [Pseudonocardiaceae bacterium]|jgi:hypothetical protein|nr:hypothetical protein [Pseudonocardiaceae bacterium]